MKVYIGADHNGFEMKNKLVNWLTEHDYVVHDCGNTKHDPADDYPDYASCVAEGVKNALESSMGIVLCGSGIGVDIVANKYHGVRCGLGINVDHVKHGRANDDINVLSIPADHISQDLAIEMVKTFLETDFSYEERHVRRRDKIDQIEKD
jgi:ribose 5-phosphate isomerase B